MLRACSEGRRCPYSGLLLQILFQNPIADPYILGIIVRSEAGGGNDAAGWCHGRFSCDQPLDSVFGRIVRRFGGNGANAAVFRRVRSVTTLLIVGMMVGYFWFGLSRLW